MENKINSHIQMPRFMLKRFENSNHIFSYYDVKEGFVGTKGHAKSTNTEYNYYSQETEDYFRDSVETPFSQVLKQFDDLDNFEYSKETENTVKSFFYSLLSRDPSLIPAIDKSNMFMQFAKVSKSYKQNNYSKMGFEIANKENYFNDYFVNVIINRTQTPFVLPVCGINYYSFRKENHLGLAIKSDLMITLIPKLFLRRYIIDNKGNYTGLLIDDNEVVKTINESAFKFQCKRNWGRVVCPEKDELDRLKSWWDNENNERQRN